MRTLICPWLSVLQLSCCSLCVSTSCPCYIGITFNQHNYGAAVWKNKNLRPLLPQYKRMKFKTTSVDTILWLCPSQLMNYETLKWLSSLPTLMQKSFWWWQCNNRYIISLPPYSPFSPSLICLMVSVAVKHHVYLLWPLLLIFTMVLKDVTEKWSSLIRVVFHQDGLSQVLLYVCVCECLLSFFRKSGFPLHAFWMTSHWVREKSTSVPKGSCVHTVVGLPSCLCRKSTHPNPQSLHTWQTALLRCPTSMSLSWLCWRYWSTAISGQNRCFCLLNSG